MTHSAQGAALLFRSTVYATCSACHNGTAGGQNRNVFRSSEVLTSGAVNNNTLRQGSGVQAAVAGTFNVNASYNPSIHNVSGAMTFAAAPGGNLVGTKWDGSAESVHKGEWDSTFSCTNCHNPHGSYSYRYLHYNPNRVASRPTHEGGLRKTDLTVQEDAGYLYAYSGATKVTGPWVYGYVSRTDTSTNYFIVTDTRGADGLGTGNLLNSFSVYYADAKFKWIPTATKPALTQDDIAALRVEVSPVLVVTAPTVIATDATANAGKIVYTTNGQNYNFFCASCHTDYERSLTTQTAFGKDPVTGGSAAANQTGIFSKAHRHTTWRGANGGMEIIAKSGNSDNMICVSCHFAHGADYSMMKTADEIVIGVAAKDIDAGAAWTQNLRNHQGNVYTSGATYLTDNSDANASSAMKRYTNMSVCYKCHTTSHAETLKNTSFYWTQYNEITNVWHKYNPAGQYK